MRIVTPCFLALVIASVGMAREEKAEANPLIGKWTAISWQRGDGKIGKDDVNTELEITKDGYEFPKGINRISSKGTYKLTPGTNHIDFTPADGFAKGKTLPGIYKVENQKLTICFRPAGSERPAAFESNNRTTVLAVYEKKKK
jgi:uncharacterized protein (TIGR03067 family)